MAMFAGLLQNAKTTPIGLDIGAQGVRAAQLTRRSQAYTLRACGKIEHANLPATSEKNEAAMSGFIRDCLHQASFQGNDVRAGLSMPDIDFHALELPESIGSEKEEEVGRIVQWEVQRLTTRQNEKLETRHWLLPAARPSAPNAIGAAATEAKVMQVVARCHDAGTVCTQVDATAAALARFGYLVADWSSEVIWGLLDLGFRQTRLILCADEVPVLIRHVGSGGEAWTERIAEALRVSQKTAEFQKREAGIELVGRGIRRDDVEAPRAELSAILTGILRADLNTMAAEVKRSYEYVLSCYPPRSAGGLLLVGGGAALRNLPEFLTNALGIPVHRAADCAMGDGSRLDVAGCNADVIDEFAVSLALAIDS